MELFLIKDTDDICGKTIAEEIIRLQNSCDEGNCWDAFLLYGKLIHSIPQNLYPFVNKHLIDLNRSELFLTNK